jgi:hypothetical protein
MSDLLHWSRENTFDMMHRTIEPDRAPGNRLPCSVD